MKRRIHSRKIKPLKLELPPEARKKQLTIIAYGNLVRIDKKPNLWCLFCDEDKQLHESLQPLSVLPYFTLGSHFNNSHLVNSTTAPSRYHINVTKDKTSLSELPRKLLQTDLSRFQGQYHKQPCIKVRNKQIQLADIMLRTFCPDPEFGKVALTALSQSFIFKHVRKHDDQLYVELEGIFDFRVTSAVARQLALLAGCEHYKSWHKGIVFSAGEALASADGMPWGCELPSFPLKVTYSVLESPGTAPFYRVAKVRPDLTLSYKAITVYLKGKSEAFRL